MYSRVIVPIDGSAWSERVALPAARVARSAGVPLWLVSFGVSGAHQAELESTAANLAATLDRVDVRVKVARAEDPAAAIAAEVAAGPGALVCMTSVGRAHLGPVFGSVAEGVLARIEGPVLVFGPDADAESFRLEGPVLVALDGSATSESILDVAADWASTFGLGVRVVSVVDPESVPARLRGDVGPESAYVHQVARRLQDRIGGQIRGARGAVDFDVLHGHDPVDALVRDALDHHVRVIAAATHGRSGLGRVVAGSVTAALVHRAPVPVLVRRPAALGRPAS